MTDLSAVSLEIDIQLQELQHHYILSKTDHYFFQTNNVFYLSLWQKVRFHSFQTILPVLRSEVTDVLL